MTIEDAIKHAEEVANNSCADCSKEHRQLADWLRELVRLRSEKTEKKYEYAVVQSGCVSPMHVECYLTVRENIPIVRREVGEWEEMR